MSMKSWVLHRVQGLGAATGRADLPPRDDRAACTRPSRRRRRGARAGARADAADRSARAPRRLRAADRRHARRARALRRQPGAPARRRSPTATRFVLTRSGVRAIGGSAAREAAAAVHARVPARAGEALPGARGDRPAAERGGRSTSSQFAGLSDLDGRDAEADDGGEYRELLAALRIAPPAEVGAALRGAACSAAGPRTRRARLAAARARRGADAVDAAGRAPRASSTSTTRAARAGPSCLRSCRAAATRSARAPTATCASTAPTRAAATPSSGSSAARWRVADAGSTNGIRVEAGRGNDPAARAARSPRRSRATALALDATARIVLSARAEGPAGRLPVDRLARRVGATGAAGAHDAGGAGGLGPGDGALRRDPIGRGRAFRARVRRAADAADGGARRTRAAKRRTRSSRRATTASDATPFARASCRSAIGRSRGQAIVVDRRHQGVSGHHLEIDAIDEQAAQGTCTATTASSIDGRRHAPARASTGRSATMLCSAARLPGEPACRFVLARRTRGLT